MDILLEHDGAARTARRVVAQCCSDAATGPECQDRSVLLTSELVTNALLHGRGRVRLGILAGPMTVRIEVGDDDPHHPRLPDQSGENESGRGILIVDQLASAWGVQDGVVGKTVWFEVGAQP
jgi:anti-sigma regulatory factor (Ser/Thr protein kinase)